MTTESAVDLAAMTEMDTRSVPWETAELHWQLNRPPQHRTPIPAAGARVFYRHTPWGPVTAAQIIEVQSLDDQDDHYLWHRHVNPLTGAPEIDGAGRYLMKPAPDPWPSLTLATDWGHRITREARVRGSAGWLPLDWATRYRPLPQMTPAPPPLMGPSSLAVGPAPLGGAR